MIFIYVQYTILLVILHICLRTVKFFNLLKRTFFSYQNLGDIILCGDFNARCGTENNFVSNDLDDVIPIDPNYVADNSRIRYSRDSKLDSRVA